MKAITERSQIREVAEAWRRQYPAGKTRSIWDDTYDRLAALDRETATAAEVAEIIGNDTWTDGYHRRCNECGREDLPGVVQLGEEPDYYESATANVCLDCLLRAVDLLGGSASPDSETASNRRKERE